MKEVADAHSSKVTDDSESGQKRHSRGVGGGLEQSSDQIAASVKAPSKKSSNRVDDDEVLAVLEKNPTCKIKDLAEIMGVSRKTLYLHLNALIKQKRIRRYGSTQNGLWKLLTKDAKA